MKKRVNYGVVGIGVVTIIFSGLVGTMFPLIWFGIPIGGLTIWCAFPTHGEDALSNDLIDSEVDNSTTQTGLSM